MIDAEGFIKIFDRAKDMINRGGYKVFSAEVETVLSSHPGVLECAIVGRPDSVLGERVHAFIVARDNVRLTAAELREFSTERMADYKVPESIDLLLEPLPRNANGKVQKDILRDRAKAGASGERWCGRRGAGRALGGTGSWKTRGIERSGVLRPWRVPPLYPLTRAHEVDSATRWGRHKAAAADSIFAQFGSRPRRSLRRSAERPARAAWAALRLLADVAIGATLELGRSWRTLLMMLLLRPRGAGELRGHRQQAALNDQRRIP